MWPSRYAHRNDRRPAVAGTAAEYQLAAARVVFARANVASWEVRIPLLTGEAVLVGREPARRYWEQTRRLAPCARAHGSEKRINAVKRSAVSTGQLSTLPCLHPRPIDLVVFQEPSSRKGTGDLVLKGVSRLYAFSVYPGRT